MIEKQLAASHDDGQNVIEIMRDSARELPYYFHFLDVAQTLGVAQINRLWLVPPPLFLRKRDSSMLWCLGGLAFVYAQGWAAHQGPFLLHCYQPPNFHGRFRSEFPGAWPMSLISTRMTPCAECSKQFESVFNFFLLILRHLRALSQTVCPASDVFLGANRARIS